MRLLSRKTSCLLTLLYLLLIFPLLANGAETNNPEVIINEIAWMGTTISANDEWIELYNNTESPVNLEGWQLISQDGTPKINLSGTIPANGFYLLERTDDTTVPNIPADQIYTGALGNGGEILELYDNFGNLIDGVDNSGGWLAGDNKTKQTMERKTDGSWQTSKSPGGTPKTKNSEQNQELRIAEDSPPPASLAETEKEQNESLPLSESLPKENEEPTPPTSLPEIYPAGIVINEILPSPEGPDAEEEWVEIFNQNNFEVDLSEWQMADTDGKITIFIFPTGTKILPQGFLVLSRPTTKITLNNEGDGLKLSQPDGNIIDEINYQKAVRGQSYNRIGSKLGWSAVLTPGSANIIPFQKEKEVKPNAETEKIEIKTPEVREETAAVGEKISIAKRTSIYQTSVKFAIKTPLSPLIALTVAVFSGAIILFLKREVKSIALLKN